MSYKLCIFGIYSFDGALPLYVTNHLRAIRSAGFTIRATCTSLLLPEAEASLRLLVDCLILRENKNYDIGGWAEALRGVELGAVDELLITNDSVYFLDTSLSKFLSKIGEVGADLSGAVMSHEISPHLQSWFLLFGRKSLAHDRVRAILSDTIPDALPRLDLVERFEVGLSRVAREAGLTMYATMDWDENRFSISADVNPSHHLWLQLVRHGVPYMKVDILGRNPHHVSLRGFASLSRGLDSAVWNAVKLDLDRRGGKDRSLLYRLKASTNEANFGFWPELFPLVTTCWLVRNKASYLRFVPYIAFVIGRRVSRYVRFKLLRPGPQR